MKAHTLSVLVENPGMSRMTIVVIGDDAQVEQVMKQLNKLIDVIKVSDITESEIVDRELALIKVNAEPGSSRSEVMQIASIFRAQIVDVGAKTVVLQVAGNPGKIDALERLLRQFGVKELIRTGKVSMLRGAKTVQPTK
ncbi:MAG: acetolactate synthase, small subunit [Methanomicrobia archaeon]|nr:acetolactate synthase, small subunit [Methanomicrobia archaeon]